MGARRRRGFRGLLILVSSAILIGLAAAPAEAVREGGPTSADFTDEEGNFDITGYLDALGEFETAPSVARGSSVGLRIFCFDVGSDIAVTFLSTSTVLFQGEVLADPMALGVQIPADASLGFHRIVVRGSSDDFPGGTATKVVNVVEGGSPDAVGALDITCTEVLAAGAEAADTDGSVPGALPFTGGEMRTWMGIGAALVLVGGALFGNLRNRRRVEASEPA